MVFLSACPLACCVNKFYQKKKKKSVLLFRGSDTTHLIDKPSGSVSDSLNGWVVPLRSFGAWASHLKRSRPNSPFSFRSIFLSLDPLVGIHRFVWGERVFRIGLGALIRLFFALMIVSGL